MCKLSGHGHKVVMGNAGAGVNRRVPNGSVRLDFTLGGGIASGSGRAATAKPLKPVTACGRLFGGARSLSHCHRVASPSQPASQAGGMWLALMAVVPPGPGIGSLPNGTPCPRGGEPFRAGGRRRKASAAPQSWVGLRLCLRAAPN